MEEYEKLNVVVISENRPMELVLQFGSIVKKRGVFLICQYGAEQEKGWSHKKRSWIYRQLIRESVGRLPTMDGSRVRSIPVFKAGIELLNLEKHSSCLLGSAF